MHKQVPWEVKLVVLIEVVVNLWSAIAYGWWDVKQGREMGIWGIGALVIGMVLVGLVGWGLWKGKRWALVVEAVLCILGILSLGIGAVLGLVRLGLLVRRESRQHFRLVKNSV